MIMDVDLVQEMVFKTKKTTNNISLLVVFS